MSNYIHTLTEIEAACGVTLEQVAAELPRCLVRNGKVTISANVGPALAGSVARCALGVPAAYIGRSLIGSVYEAD